MIYVTNPGASNVTVYAYRDAQHAPLVLTLSGLSHPVGECVDAKQNVFVVDNQADTILKFARGGASPIGKLTNSYGIGWSCALNPINGDLAVVNFETFSGYSGNVLVYPKARGTPHVYTDPHLSSLSYAAYDTNGNLYVDAWNYRDNGVALVELAKGGSSLTPVKLRGATIASPGGLQWADGYLLLADNNYRHEDTTVVYVVKVASGDMQVVRKVPLNDSGGVGQFWRLGPHIIAPAGDVEIYSYRNGDLSGVITKGIFEPTATVVSMP